MDQFLVYKQKTAYEMRISDWSSDVCSSDLGALKLAAGMTVRDAQAPGRFEPLNVPDFALTLKDSRIAATGSLRAPRNDALRSEERRVGKECVSTCRYRWPPSH